MECFYRILFQEDENLGVAFTRSPTELLLPYTGRVENWISLGFELRDGDFPDYLANNLGCRICSSRLKDILERSASARDVLQWLEVRVQKGTQERLYYVLHFPEPPDVLDKRRTLFSGGDFVVKPVLSQAATAVHGVFTYPKNEGLPFFVSEKVKQEIERVGCTGLEFSSVATA
jgi:hypothetical protein